MNEIDTNKNSFEKSEKVSKENNESNDKPVENGKAETGKNDWGFTELESKNLVLATIVIVMGLITLGTWVAMASWDDEDTVRRTAKLRVDNVFVMLKEEDTDEQTYTLDLVVFLTNSETTTAKNVHLEVAGIDYNSKLTYTIGTQNVNDISGERTEEIHVRITIPIVQTYKTLIMVFQDDTIKIKGYNYITIEDSGPRKDFTVYYSKESTKEVVDSGDDDISEFTIFMGYLFYVILIMELYIVFRLMDFKALRSAVNKIMTGLRNRG